MNGLVSEHLTANLHHSPFNFAIDSP